MEKKVKLHIKGLTCTSCVQSIESSLKKIDGINFAGVNIANNTALIKYDPKILNVKITERKRLSKKRFLFCDMVYYNNQTLYNGIEINREVTHGKEYTKNWNYYRWWRL